jgi:hypothetical protein
VNVRQDDDDTKKPSFSNSFRMIISNVVVVLVYARPPSNRLPFTFLLTFPCFSIIKDYFICEIRVSLATVDLVSSNRVAVLRSQDHFINSGSQDHSIYSGSQDHSIYSGSQDHSIYSGSQDHSIYSGSVPTQGNLFSSSPIVIQYLPCNSLHTFL